MIRLSSHMTTWKSSVFTWPNLTGQNSSPIYFNHNRGIMPDHIDIVGEYSAGDLRTMLPFDRNGAAFYGHRIDGGGDSYNTVLVRLYRGTTSAIDAYATLIFYS